MVILHGAQDITEFISSMSWGGSRQEVARKLELKVVNAPLDPNIVPPQLELASPITLFDDNGAELFRGIVTDREASSVTGTITYIVHDILYYTLKSKATYNFSGKTAEEITAMVCSDVGIPVGNLASTGISQKLIVQNVSIYDIIMQAYTQAHEQNGKLYMVTASYGKLNVVEMGNLVCSMLFTEDSNILVSNYTETLANMVNKVRIYDGEGSPIGMVQNGADVGRYGTFQQVYTKEEGKDANTTARSMLHGVDKTFEFECLNHNEAITGSGMIVYDTTTKLRGIVWIDADAHTWTNGVATMKLTVTLQQIMDEKEASGESGVGGDSKKSGGSGSKSGNNTAKAESEEIQEGAKTDKPKADSSEKVSVMTAKPPYYANPSYKNVNLNSAPLKFDNYSDAVKFMTQAEKHGGTNNTTFTLVDSKGKEVAW